MDLVVPLLCSHECIFHFIIQLIMMTILMERDCIFYLLKKEHLSCASS